MFYDEEVTALEMKRRQLEVSIRRAEISSRESALSVALVEARGVRLRRGFAALAAEVNLTRRSAGVDAKAASHMLAHQARLLARTGRQQRDVQIAIIGLRRSHSETVALLEAGMKKREGVVEAISRVKSIMAARKEAITAEIINESVIAGRLQSKPTRGRACEYEKWDRGAVTILSEPAVGICGPGSQAPRHGGYEGEVSLDSGAGDAVLMSGGRAEEETLPDKEARRMRGEILELSSAGSGAEASLALKYADKGGVEYDVTARRKSGGKIELTVAGGQGRLSSAEAAGMHERIRRVLNREGLEAGVIRLTEAACPK